MLKTDKTGIIILLLIIVFYIIILSIDLVSNLAPDYISFLNALTSFSLLFYWVTRQLRISKHYYELRETVVLVAESLFLVAAVYTIFSNTENVFFDVAQYIIYGLHFIALLLVLIFMLTFKMKRLF